MVTIHEYPIKPETELMDVDRMRAQIDWTHAADLRPHRRRMVFEVEVPLVGACTKIEEAMLSLGDGPTERSIIIRLDGTFTEEPDADTIAAAIRAEARGQADERERVLSERLAKVREAISSGELRPLLRWGTELDRETYRDAMTRISDDEKQQLSALVEEHERSRRDREAEAEAQRAEHRRFQAASKEAEAVRAAASRAREAERKQRRSEAIRLWATQHGSARLRELIELKYDPTSLYRKERLAHELDESAVVWQGDDDDLESVPCPNAEQLVAERRLAERLLELGTYGSLDEAFRGTSVERLAKYESNDEYYDGPTYSYYVVASWRPGDDCFDKVQVAVPIPA